MYSNYSMDSISFTFQRRILNLYKWFLVSTRYGIHLAQALTNKVIDRGYTPFVVIRPENDASRSLYTKLGYKKAYETVRVTLQPKVVVATDIDNNDVEKHNGHCANGHIIDIQNDEGIEDMRTEIVQNNNSNQNDVAKDEGIDNGEE